MRHRKNLSRLLMSFTAQSSFGHYQTKKHHSGKGRSSENLHPFCLSRRKIRHSDRAIVLAKERDKGEARITHYVVAILPKFQRKRGTPCLSRMQGLDRVATSITELSRSIKERIRVNKCVLRLNSRFQSFGFGTGLLAALILNTVEHFEDRFLLSFLMKSYKSHSYAFSETHKLCQLLAEKVCGKEANVICK